MKNLKHSAIGHALAIGATLLVVIAVSAAWVVHLKVGPPLDGWTAGITVIFVPFLLIIFVGAWLILRLIVRRFLMLSILHVAWTSALAAYAVIVVMCGPVACLAVSRPERGMGLFLVGGTVLIALVHHLVLSRFKKQGPEPSHAAPPPTL